MSDVDVLVLERFQDAVAALRDAGFAEVARGDHAWAFRDPAGERDRGAPPQRGVGARTSSRSTAEGLWQRRRAGRSQLPAWPSAEDLLLQLALHAAFQHGLVLSLVQWLDFPPAAGARGARRRARAGARGGVARARPLAAALRVAEVVVGAPVPKALLAGVPRGMASFLDAQLATPLAFVAPSEPDLARVRLDLLAGRRARLVWRTLVQPETPDGDERLRLSPALRVLARVAPRARGRCGRPAAERPRSRRASGSRGRRGQVPFGEELLRDCLASFPHVRLTVTGCCMEPAIAHGDKVQLVRAPRARGRAVGDVVLSRQKEGLRLHRLVFGPPIALPGSRWRTKADRGLLLDPPLDARDVAGQGRGDRGTAAGAAAAPLRALVSLARGLAARARGVARQDAEALS